MTLARCRYVALGWLLAACNGGNPRATRATTSVPYDAGQATPPATPPPLPPPQATPPGAAGTVARTVYDGTATGRGVDPPIHAYAPRLQADPWHAQGTVHLEIPASDGTVTGTLSLHGFDLLVRGARTGSHVQATLDPSPLNGAAEPDDRPDAADPRESVFRGTLDGELVQGAVHATWEASAQGGVRRREGTLDARPSEPTPPR